MARPKPKAGGAGGGAFSRLARDRLERSSSRNNGGANQQQLAASGHSSMSGAFDGSSFRDGGGMPSSATGGEGGGGGPVVGEMDALASILGNQALHASFSGYPTPVPAHRHRSDVAVAGRTGLNHVFGEDEEENSRKGLYPDGVDTSSASGATLSTRGSDFTPPQLVPQHWGDADIEGEARRAWGAAGDVRTTDVGASLDNKSIDQLERERRAAAAAQQKPKKGRRFPAPRIKLGTGGGGRDGGGSGGNATTPSRGEHRRAQSALTSSLPPQAPARPFTPSSSKPTTTTTSSPPNDRGVTHNRSWSSPNVAALLKRGSRGRSASPSPGPARDTVRGSSRRRGGSRNSSPARGERRRADSYNGNSDQTPLRKNLRTRPVDLDDSPACSEPPSTPDRTTNGNNNDEDDIIRPSRSGGSAIVDLDTSLDCTTDEDDDESVVVAKSISSPGHRRQNTGDALVPDPSQQRGRGRSAAGTSDAVVPDPAQPYPLHRFSTPKNDMTPMDADAIARSPSKDDALQSPSRTSPGTLRLTSDGLRRHERKTSMHKDLPPALVPPTIAEISKDGCGDMAEAVESEVAIVPPLPPVAAKMSPAEWRRRREAQRKLTEQARQALELDETAEITNKAGATTQAKERRRSGGGRSFSPPSPLDLAMPMPEDEGSGLGAADLLPPVGSCLSNDSNSSGSSLRKLKKGVKKQLGALRVARSGSSDVEQTTTSNKAAAKAALDDASTSAQSKLSTTPCAPDDVGLGLNVNLSLRDDGEDDDEAAEVLMESSNGSSGAGDDKQGRGDKKERGGGAKLQNRLQAVRKKAKGGMKRRSAEHGKQPKWFERQVIQEEGEGQDELGIAQQTAGQRNEESPQWMMMGMSRSSGGGETTAEAPAGWRRARGRRKGAENTTMLDNTVTFDSMRGLDDSEGVEIAHCDDDDEDDGQKSCSMTSMHSVATAQVDNRRTARLPVTPVGFRSHSESSGLSGLTSLSPSEGGNPHTSTRAGAGATVTASIPGRCAVCGHGQRTHLAVPCMHLSFCARCVDEMRAGGEKSCPVCGEDDVTFSKVNL